MTLSRESLAGPGYIILNGIRVLNVIGLLAIIAASILMLVKTTTNSSFFFFDAVTNVVSVFAAAFLLISELTFFPSWFARNMPLLSPNHGFVTLSLALFVLGVDLLAKLNHESDSQKTLGLAFWRVAIGAGIISFVLGVVNFVASYVFRDMKQGITARQVRAHGAVASHMSPDASKMSPISTRSATSDFRNPTTPTRHSRNPLRLITDPLSVIHERLDGKHNEPILPSYQASTSPISTRSLSPEINRSNQTPPRAEMQEASNKNNNQPVSPSSRYSRLTACSKKQVFNGFHFGLGGKKRESLAPPLPLNISAPLNTNPQFKHLVRPDSALHPARSYEGDPYRWKP